MLLDLDPELMLRVLRVSVEKLSGKVKEALVHGVETVLGMRLVEGDLNNYERRLLRFRYVGVVPNIKSERLIKVLSNPYSVALCNQVVGYNLPILYPKPIDSYIDGLPMEPLVNCEGST